MRTLVLPPDMALSFSLAPARRSTALRSPSRFSGLMELEQVAEVSVEWSSLDPQEYGYLTAFWRQHAGRYPHRFLIELPKGSSGPSLHIAAFTGNLRVTSVTGGSANVSGSLWAIEASPVHPTSEAGVDLIALVATEV